MANEKTESGILGGDSRLKKAAAPDSRADRSVADSERTDKDGTVLSTSERRTNFRDEWAATALPTPPPIPGYHCCWLSTTNAQDPIHKRMRMGYSPVNASETPGYEHYKIKSGEYEGQVGCNEMLLFKIPNDLYQEIMSYYHHEKPNEDEEMIKQNDAISEQNRANIARAEEDGFRALAARTQAPVFS